MDNNLKLVVVVVGAVIAYVLQIVVAPAITIVSAMPNFIAIFAAIYTVSRARATSYVVPFVLGLIFDFVSGGPVGALAFSLTLSCAIASLLFSALDNDTIFVALVSVVVALLLTEVIYGIFLLAMGYEAGVLQALVYRALPCALYDCVLGCILYPLIVRLYAPSGPAGSPIITHLR